MRRHRTLHSRGTERVRGRKQDGPTATVAEQVGSDLQAVDHLVGVSVSPHIVASMPFTVIHHNAILQSDTHTTDAHTIPLADGPCVRRGAVNAIEHHAVPPALEHRPCFLLQPPGDESQFVG